MPPQLNNELKDGNMTNTEVNPSAGWRMKVAAFSLAVSIFTALWFVIAALGTKFGLWTWQTGLLQMTGKIGAPLAFSALGLSLIAQVIALIKFPRKQAFIIALAATLLAAYSTGRLIAMKMQSETVPPIHDIQTDWDAPIGFSETLMAARNADVESNPVVDAPVIDDDRLPDVLQGRLVAEIQEQAEAQETGKGTVYPPLQPLFFSTSPSEVAGLVERIISKKGWSIVTPMPSDPDSGEEFQIEATATSGWFGFKDDVAIRIRPVEGAVRVDMRSVSRVGISDLGANSKRISGFMNELRDRGDGRVSP